MDYPFYSREEVLRKVPFSLSTLLRLEKLGDFPKPIKVARRRVVYKKTEVDGWFQNLTE